MCTTEEPAEVDVAVAEPEVLASARAAAAQTQLAKIGYVNIDRKKPNTTKTRTSSARPRAGRIVAAVS